MPVATKFWVLFGLLIVLGCALSVSGQVNKVAEELKKFIVNPDEKKDEAKPVDGKKKDDEDDDWEEDEKEKEPSEENVIVLTNENFDEITSKHDTILVEFYAPWCGHCKSLKPQYAKAATELKDHKPPVALAMVDATVHEELAKKFEVTGYPTLKLKKGDTWLDYDGGRDGDGIVRFMKERADPNWKPPPPAVVTLTKDNFKEFIKENTLVLVEFYAPWCGHCKELAPQYEKAAKQLRAHTPSIPCTKVDATVEKELAEEFNVTGYPTFKMFRKGRLTEYKGGRDEYGIYDYMIRQTGDASREVHERKDVKKNLPLDDIVVIGFFDSDKDPLYEEYQNAANEMREDHKFRHSFDKSFHKQYNMKPGTIVVYMPERYYTKYEEKQSILQQADAKEEDIIKFVKSHNMPLVGEVNKVYLPKRYSARPLCMVFYYVDYSITHTAGTQIWRLKIADIAKDYRKITFAIADEEEMSDQVKELKLDESGETLNIGCYDEKQKKFAMEPMEEYDPDHIRDFLDKFEKGELKPIIKSQLVPKKLSGPVVTLVGSTFDDIVLDKSKDVLVEIYAPWCGHCKEFEPAYKKLAKQLKSEKNLVIAKIDSTANDIPEEFKVEGFPTIYFSPATAKDKPVKYEGQRSAEDLIKFMKEHAALSFDTKRSKEEL